MPKDKYKEPNQHHALVSVMYPLDVNTQMIPKVIVGQFELSLVMDKICINVKHE